MSSHARVETAVSAARWLGPLGNYLVACPAARAAAHRAGERTDVPRGDVRGFVAAFAQHRASAGA